MSSAALHLSFYELTVDIIASVASMVYDNRLEAVVVVAAVVRVVDLAVAAVADMALAVAETADQVCFASQSLRKPLTLQILLASQYRMCPVSVAIYVLHPMSIWLLHLFLNASGCLSVRQQTGTIGNRNMATYHHTYIGHSVATSLSAT